MKIGMVVPHAGYAGGIEKYAHDLSRSLRERGHHLTLIYLDERGRDRQAYAAAFDDVRAMDSRNVADDLDVVYVHRANRADELAPFRRVPTVVASHDHDLTCIRSHRYLPLSLEPCHRPPGLSCVQHGCVVVRSRRPGALLPIALRDPFKLRKELLALSARARLVACSQYIATNIRNAGVAADRVEVIHPIPPENDLPLAPRPQGRSLAVVGQLLRGKGFEHAIDAMALLPADVTLEIAGDGPSKRVLRDRASEVAQDRVRFLGYVSPESMHEIYDRASIVLVPSHWPEPFGMVGIEAMRRARPVVGANHGGIPEWLKEPAAGRLFVPTNARSLADSVLTLLDDDKAGERAHEFVRTHFEHKTMVDAVEAMLERTMKERLA
jgi:glycosyltransferase involved in cell wall biosynthesis